MRRQVTGPLLKVLQALLESPSDEKYGLEIFRATKVKPGTLYPLLERLEDGGMLESRWEAQDESTSGGPRRRFYRLTATGVHEARQIVLEHAPTGLTAWA
jgi:DNA-binding PadR family transcriptional regulator